MLKAKSAQQYKNGIFLFSFLFREIGESDKKRKRTTEDKTQSGEEEKRRKKEGKDTEVKEPEAKKKKSKDDSSSGSDDEEASIYAIRLSHCHHCFWERCHKNMLLSTLISLNLRKIKAERNSKMQMWTKMCGGGKLMNWESTFIHSSHQKLRANDKM